MAPGSSSRSKDYTESTTYIACWLGKTANQYGFFSSRSTQLKYNSHSSQRVYEVEREDFLPMAEYIARHETTNTYLPPDFFVRLDRVIRQRRDRHQKYCRTTSAKDVRTQRGNDTHAGFIRILEAVRSILQEQRTFIPKRRANENSKLTQNETRPDESEKVPTKSLGLHDFQFTDDLLHDIEGKFSLLDCLMDDFSEIRKACRELWSRYLTGEMDLVTVSLATNSVLELAQGFEEEFYKLTGSSNDLEELLGILWLSHCAVVGVDPTGSLEDGRFPDSIYEVSSTFFWPLRLNLRGYLSIWTPNQMPVYKTDYYGNRSTFGTLPSLSARQRFHVDKMIVSAILPHFDAVARSGERSADFDELTNGMCSMFETGTIPLWLTLAVRIFLDIHCELGERVQVGHQELAKTAQMYADNMTEIQSLHKEWPVSNWSADGSIFLQHFTDELRNLDSKDIVRDLIRTTAVECSTETLLDCEKHYLLKNHPLLCGLKLYAIRARYHDVSIKFVNAAGAVISCTHLYHALKQENLLCRRWRDIELLLRIQNGDHLFAGPTPCDPRAYLLRYSTMLRKASEAQPELNQHHHSQQSLHQPLPALAPGTKLFMPRYVRGLRQCGIVPIEAQLHKIKKMVSTAETGGTITSRLNYLCASLCDETLEFCLDYLQLHHSCWMMLDKVKKELLRHDTCKLELDDLEDEAQLPLLTLVILQRLVHRCVVSNVGSNSASARSDQQMENDIVKSVSDVVDAVCHLKSDPAGCCFGEVCTMRLSCMCKVDLASVS